MIKTTTRHKKKKKRVKKMSQIKLWWCPKVVGGNIANRKRSLCLHDSSTYVVVLEQLDVVIIRSTIRVIETLMN